MGAIVLVTIGARNRGKALNRRDRRCWAFTGCGCGCGTARAESDCSGGDDGNDGRDHEQRISPGSRIGSDRPGRWERSE